MERATMTNALSSNEQETLILQALCCGDTAKSLMMLSEIACLPFQEVATVVDRLIAQKILMSDNSFIPSEMGVMVYSFAANDTAQATYSALQRPCERASCPNDAEYMSFPEEKTIYHARFCQHCRKQSLLLFPKKEQETNDPTPIS